MAHGDDYDAQQIDTLARNLSGTQVRALDRIHGRFQARPDGVKRPTLKVLLRFRLLDEHPVDRGVFRRTKLGGRVMRRAHHNQRRALGLSR